MKRKAKEKMLANQAADKAEEEICIFTPAPASTPLSGQNLSSEASTLSEDDNDNETPLPDPLT